MNETTQPAVAGPVEPSVRPSVAVAHGSDAHLDLIGSPWHMHMFGGQDRADILAFGRACMAAERERCARICDTTPPDPFRPSIEAAHAIRSVTTNDIAGQDAGADEPVSSAYELKPAAWIAGNGHPHHLSHIQGVRERQLYGPLRPLYDEQAMWNACARAEGIGRDQIKAQLLKLHEAHKHQHNYFAWAVQELFVARRFSGRVA